MQEELRVGVEVGGTFTDLVAIGPDGIRVTKVPSTPANPELGALDALAASGLAVPEIVDLAHGSTVATNAVLERKGYRTAFVTTEGFRDLMFLQRQGRSRIYDLEYQKPRPVMERADCYEVRERVLADGTVETALDPDAVRVRLIPALAAGGYQAVAICLLNAYVNPRHEAALRALIGAALPQMTLTLSHDVTREFREFERASTTSLSAYVQPVMDRYITRFAERLGEAGFAGRFSLMQSNGGRLPADAMRSNAITALLSGPAAGVIGAARQAGRTGYGNLLTLDMGGTSTDVSVVTDGRPQLTQEFSIDGLPIRLPLIDIHTIGAGGGSIVWVDDGGMLRVGPQSAGAVPGPACYKRGGTQPTLTDAHVIRGTVRAEAFLGGRMEIDPTLSHTAFEPVAARFGMSVPEAADSAVQLANANVVRAIQLISTERGLDPRDYVLAPYGGAGPLHAAKVAEELGVRRIVVPPSAGVVSAYGLIASDFTQYSSLTRRALIDECAADVLRSAYDELQRNALARAAAMGLSGQPEFEIFADMRFVGQAFEVPVRFAPEDLPELTSVDVADRFREEHHKVYFFGGEVGKPVEFVSFRLGLRYPIARLPVLEETAAPTTGERDIDLFDSGMRQKGRLVARNALRPGSEVAGPALLEDPTSTVFLPMGWTATRDDADNTIMTWKTSDA
ncbi:MAG: hydantoinase/oxoprolinase family protein [Pseudomonadota bacterium]